MDEIERKFVAEIDWTLLPAEAGVKRQQGYIVATDPEVRIARFLSSSGLDYGYCMTVKTGSGIRRGEVNLDVPTHAGQQLFNMVDPAGVITKVRYTVGGWEVDIFHGRHAGLILAEAELSTEESPLPIIPEFLYLRKEVTEDGRFKNKNLARMSEGELKYLVTTINKG